MEEGDFGVRCGNFAVPTEYFGVKCDFGPGTNGEGDFGVPQADFGVRSAYFGDESRCFGGRWQRQ